MSTKNQQTVRLVSWEELIGDLLGKANVENQKTNRLFVILSFDRTQTFHEGTWQPLYVNEIGTCITAMRKESALQICQNNGWAIE